MPKSTLSPRPSASADLSSGSNNISSAPGPVSDVALPPGVTLEGRDATGALALTTTEPEDEDALLGHQLTMQWEKAVGGQRDQIVFGAMMMKLRANLSARGQVSKGGRGHKGEGLEGWLEKHAPKVSRGTAYRLMEIAEGVQEICKLGKKIDLEELLACSVEDVPAQLLKKRQEIEKLIEGKSQRQLLLSFGGASGKARGGDTSKSARKLTPEEEHERMVANLREDSTVPFHGLEIMGEAWKILTDAEIETRIEIAAAWIATAQGWLKTPKSKRPVLDVVQAVHRNETF